MKDELFQELLASVREVGAIIRGEAKPAREFHRHKNDIQSNDPDVKAIRETFGISQSKFAAMLGISKRTLEGWEQGRRRPEGPARRLLQVAAKHPEEVLDTIFGREATASINVSRTSGRKRAGTRANP